MVQIYPRQTKNLVFLLLQNGHWRCWCRLQGWLAPGGYRTLPSRQLVSILILYFSTLYYLALLLSLYCTILDFSVLYLLFLLPHFTLWFTLWHWQLVSILILYFTFLDFTLPNFTVLYSTFIVFSLLYVMLLYVIINKCGLLHSSSVCRHYTFNALDCKSSVLNLVVFWGNAIRALNHESWCLIQLFFDPLLDKQFLNNY